jgi:molecular chaperone GrpE
MDNEKEQLTPSQPESAVDGKALNNAVPEHIDVSQAPAGDSEIMAACEKLKAEKAELYDLLLRKQAEFENFRKRAHREKEEFRHHATESLVRALLPVLDGFDRALKQHDPNVPEPFLQGLELIHRQLFDTLAQAGLEAVETSGQLFDPHYHQAVETVEDANRRDHEIVEELQRGYKMKNRLLRPAIVRVAVKPQAEDAQPPRKAQKAD